MRRNQAWLDAIGEERAAAWARFFAVAPDSNPGQLEYDRALAAAKKLDAEIAANKAAFTAGTAPVRASVTAS